MNTATYRVVGMSCSHCIASVTAELAKLPGVTDVDVDLDSGDVTVLSDQSLDLDEVRAAVDEAGYQLAP